jgi:ATP-dependent exoDNAse (exonuclease V) beta subunit
MTSRALGSAVHRTLQELARLRTALDWPTARAALTQFHDRLAAQARALGMDRLNANALARQALDIALRASQDPAAEWILSPHAVAVNEERWTGIIDGTLRTVQADRVFRAGSVPRSEDANVWWIVDYKTAHPSNLASAEVLSNLRPLFAPQLEIYATVLRKLHGQQASIRAGLYYPRMLQFDWWEL